MKSIVIFASGSGSNAENIIATLSPQSLHVTRIYCNNPNAGIIARAERLKVPVCLIPKSDWSESGDYEWQQQLRKDAPDLIVLAGFLWKIPSLFAPPLIFSSSIETAAAKCHTYSHGIRTTMRLHPHLFSDFFFSFLFFMIQKTKRKRPTQLQQCGI